MCELCLQKALLSNSLSNNTQANKKKLEASMIEHQQILKTPNSTLVESTKG